METAHATARACRRLPPPVDVQRLCGGSLVLMLGMRLQIVYKDLIKEKIIEHVKEVPVHIDMEVIKTVEKPVYVDRVVVQKVEKIRYGIERGVERDRDEDGDRDSKTGQK